MEYGEAISGRDLERAVALATEEFRRHPHRALADVAAGAVAQIYCVCVTDGEDAAEGRLSDVHRMLIEQVVERVLEQESHRAADLAVSERGAP